MKYFLSLLFLLITSPMIAEGVNTPLADRLLPYPLYGDPLPHPEMKINGIPFSCMEKMEAAMREIDSLYIHPPLTPVESYDGCNTCTENSCTLMACEYGPERDLSRLNWEVERTKRQIERNKLKTDALKRWDATKKDCWRQP